MKRTDLDLAGRALGGSARYVGDEFFAACEALLMPGPAIHDTTTFGPHGKISPWCRVRRRAGTPPKPTGSTSTRAVRARAAQHLSGRWGRPVAGERIRRARSSGA